MLKLIQRENEPTPALNNGQDARAVQKNPLGGSHAERVNTGGIECYCVSLRHQFDRAALLK
jgi:hypothetical protein